MARGRSSKDNREVFHQDRVRFINRQADPVKAPETNTCEVYIKKNDLFLICDKGIARPLNAVGVSASPGFTWGRNGTVKAKNKVYLLNNEVPSNVTGRFVQFIGTTVRQVLFNNSDNNATCTIELQEHDGSTFTTLVSVSLSNERNVTLDFNVPVTTGLELAVKVTSGECKNPVVGVILDGLF